ncbi:MAG: cob(I)yrinic acid a,c-diamide adenosyltransferase [Verrucomicrobiota bacterium]
MSTTFSITTRQGDGGETSLFSGETVSKASLRTEAYGTLDELNSALGMALSHCKNEDIRARILALQQDLFVVCAELATSPDFLDQLKDRLDDARAQRLEADRDELEAAIQMPAGFIIPGGTVVGACLDMARSISRRAERRTVAVIEGGESMSDRVLPWINRLSDYLWLLARYEEGDRVILKDA